LEFLPPYSPDYNPIEEAFAELKAWCKRNQVLIDSYASYDLFLEAGLRHLQKNPGNHFRSALIDLES
jgi:transposase